MKRESVVRDWHWEITRNCNLQCRHCVLGGRDNYELTTRKSFEVISHIVWHGGRNLSITGGEPFMREDLGLIIQKASLSGLKVELITNGILVSDDFLVKSGEFVNRIAVSIDGQMNIHNHIRGKGSYEKAIHAIMRILNAGIDLSVYITLHKLNKDFIAPLVNELISIGVRSFHFNEINKEGTAVKNQHLILEEQDISEKLNNIVLQLRELIEFEEVVCNRGCNISSDSVYMSSEGNIYPCVEFAFNSPKNMIANIFHSDLDRTLKKYFSEASFQQNCVCCYTSFSMQGVNILLNESCVCPII